jgi:hypothetical protein
MVHITTWPTASKCLLHFKILRRNGEGENSKWWSYILYGLRKYCSLIVFPIAFQNHIHAKSIIVPEESGAIFRLTDSVFNAINRRNSCRVIFCDQQKLLIVQIKFCWTNCVSVVFREQRQNNSDLILLLEYRKLELNRLM